MTSTLYPVIMCGGAGSRLWPKSRRAQPKQFLPLIDDTSLLEATIQRLDSAPGDITVSSPTIICGAGQDGLAGEQLERCGHRGSPVIIEPFGRNTAAVAAIASLHALSADPEALVLLLPADHYVKDPEGFWSGVSAGLEAAAEGYLVTLGIEPTGPETGYGYIHKGEPMGPSVFKVQNFKEKPDSATAETYVSTGEYFWNAGIFLFRADAMIAAFEAHAPDILSASQAALEQASRDGARHLLDPVAFEACPSEPVDIAIMEKSNKVAIVAPVRAGWSDVGSWSVIAELKAASCDNPAGATSGDVMVVDCENCLIESDGPTVAAIGLKDMIVIVDGGSVLIVPKSRTQDVKKIVNQLKIDGREEKL